MPKKPTKEELKELKELAEHGDITAKKILKELKK